MSNQNNDILSRRNAIKLGVASLSSVGMVAGAQAHKSDDSIKTIISNHRYNFTY